VRSQVWKGRRMTSKWCAHATSICMGREGFSGLGGKNARPPNQKHRYCRLQKVWATLKEENQWTGKYYGKVFASWAHSELHNAGKVVEIVIFSDQGRHTHLGDRHASNELTRVHTSTGIVRRRICVSNARRCELDGSFPWPPCRRPTWGLPGLAVVSS